MARYVPSGKVGAAGTAAVLAVGLVSAAVLAVLVHYVGRLFYLILIFPLIWGFLLGAALAVGVKLGKCRSVVLALLAGLVVPAASYGVFHHLENAQVRAAVKDGLRNETGASDADVEAGYSGYLQKEFGTTGFWAEVKLRSTFGMNISRRGSSSSGKPMITGTGMYVYWGIEWAAITLCCLFLPLAAAKAVFCETCQAWYEKKDVSVVRTGSESKVLAALGAKDFAALPGCFGGGSTVLSLEKCPTCTTSDIRVILEQVVRDDKGKETRSTVFDDLFTREEANGLLAAVAAPPPPAAPPPAENPK